MTKVAAPRLRPRKEFEELLAESLEDKYKVPLTFNQSIGFKVEDPRNKDLIKQERHPINKCPETKYAEEMIKTGFPM